MALILKQSTAVDVLIGPFVDLTDGATAETGESPTVKLSKNGQTLAAKNDVTTPVHDADGYYNCELDATDTNTVGTVVLTVAASASALPVRHEFYVVEEAVYDAMYGASAAGPLQSATAGRTLVVDAAGLADANMVKAGPTGSGTAITARDLGASVLLSPGTGTGQISLASGAVTAGTVSDKTGYSLTQAFPSNFADMAITVTTGRVTAGTVSDKTGYSLTAGTGLGNQTADITGNLSGSVGSVTGAVGSVTGAVGSVAGNVDGSVASVTGAVGSVTGAVGSVTGSVGSVVGHTAQTGDTFALANGAAGFVAIDAVVDSLNLGIITGAAATGTLSTTQATSDLTGYADDQLIGRVIIWTSGACDGEATDITDYASASGLLTFTALTTAPANGDTFKIV